MTSTLRALSAALWFLCAIGAQGADTKVLNIYNWTDYIAPDTIRNFEKETGIKVRYDTYDLDEVLQARLLIGNSGYDIVVPGTDFAKTQIDSGGFQKLDRSKLTNWGNLDNAILEQMARVDPGNQYLVNWLWGFTTVGINTHRLQSALGDLKMPANPWQLVFDPQYAARAKSCGISVIDSPSVILPLALSYMGKPPFSKSTGDYNDASAMLRAVRPYIAHFSASGYIDRLASGDLCVVIGYSGDINIARSRAQQAKKGEVIEALVPKTGATLFFDSMAIPRDAQNVENAHLFINYILRPEVHASLTNKVFYANPNTAAMKFVSKDVASNRTVFPEADALRGMVVPEALPQNVRKVQARTYSIFKSGL
jgi:putrescine transport system substrate-binding protein